MSDTSYIGKEYKRRYKEKAEELGVEMLPWDEFWKISEWAKNEYRKHIDARGKGKSEEPVQTGDIKCEKCGDIFPKIKQRGRPPKKCPACRGVGV